MKIRNVIPAMMALLVLLCAPFNFLPLCGSEAEGDLVCYCCIDSGKKCTILSCSGCKGKSSLDNPRLAPEMIPLASDPIVHFVSAYLEAKPLHLPGIVYIEVPVRPPVAI